MRGNGEAATYLSTRRRRRPRSPARRSSPRWADSALSFGDAEGAHHPSRVGDIQPHVQLQGLHDPCRHRGRTALPAVLATRPAERPGRIRVQGRAAFRNSGAAGTLLMLRGLTNNAGGRTSTSHGRLHVRPGTLAFGAHHPVAADLTAHPIPGADHHRRLLRRRRPERQGFLTIPLDLGPATASRSAVVRPGPADGIAGISSRPRDRKAIPATEQAVSTAGSSGQSPRRLVLDGARRHPASPVGRPPTPPSPATPTAAPASPSARDRPHRRWPDLVPARGPPAQVLGRRRLLPDDTAGDHRLRGRPGGALDLRRGVDSRPTRIQVDYPAARPGHRHGRRRRRPAPDPLHHDVDARNVLHGRPRRSVRRCSPAAPAGCASPTAGARPRGPSPTTSRSCSTEMTLDGLRPTQLIRVQLPASHFTPSLRGMHAG